MSTGVNYGIISFNRLWHMCVYPYPLLCCSCSSSLLCSCPLVVSVIVVCSCVRRCNMYSGVTPQNKRNQVEFSALLDELSVFFPYTRLVSERPCPGCIPFSARRIKCREWRCRTRLRHEARVPMPRTVAGSRASQRTRFDNPWPRPKWLWFVLLVRGRPSAAAPAATTPTQQSWFHKMTCWMTNCHHHTLGGCYYSCCNCFAFGKTTRRWERHLPQKESKWCDWLRI